MRTAVLAVLVAVDAGLTPEEIAYNFNVSEKMAKRQLDELQREGHVKRGENVYFPVNGAKTVIVNTSTGKSSHG